MKSLRVRAGFTLLEVLIGLVILGLAAVTFGAAYVNTWQAARAAQATARDAGDWRMVRALVLGEPRREAVERGGDLVLGADQRVRWSANIQPAGILDLFEVRLEGEIVGRGSQPRPHQEVFWVLRPTWTGATERARLLDRARQRPSGVNRT